MGKALSTMDETTSAALLEEVSHYAPYKCALPITCRDLYNVWGIARVCNPAVIIGLQNSNQVRIFNLRSREFTALPDSVQQRTDCCYAMVGDCLYVFGGKQPAWMRRHAGHHVADRWQMNTVERFSLSTWTWTTVAPMPRGRSGSNVLYPMFAVALNGSLYIFGGTEELDCTDRFNLATSTVLVY